MNSWGFYEDRSRFYYKWTKFSCWEDKIFIIIRRYFLLFDYLIGYKAWLLVKLSRACLLVKKIIYNKILKYQRIHWENIREKINTTIIIHLANATIFSCPVFSSTQRNVSRILLQSNDLSTDCMQYYSNYIRPKVLYPSHKFRRAGIQ